MSTSYLFSHDGLRDSLTHLYAPSFIYDVVERRLKSAERNRRPLTLIKVVIDAPIEEATIIDVSEVLTTQLRPDDIIGRMGINEFLIVLALTETEKSYEEVLLGICDRCRSASTARLQFSAVESLHQERLSTLFNRLDGALSLDLPAH